VTASSTTAKAGSSPRTAGPVFNAGEDLLVIDPVNEELGRDGTAPFTVLEYSFDAEPLIAYKRDKVETALTRLRITPQWIGVQTGSGDGYAVSGTSLRLRAIPTTRAGNSKGKQWDKALPQLVRALQRLDALPEADGGFGQQWAQADEPPGVKRGNPMPNDEVEEATIEATLVGAGVKSVRQSVRDQHPEWTDEDVDAEVARSAPTAPPRPRSAGSREQAGSRRVLRARPPRRALGVFRLRWRGRANPDGSRHRRRQRAYWPASFTSTASEESREQASQEPPSAYSRVRPGLRLLSACRDTRRPAPSARRLTGREAHTSAAGPRRPLAIMHRARPHTLPPLLADALELARLERARAPWGPWLARIPGPLNADDGDTGDTGDKGDQGDRDRDRGRPGHRPRRRPRPHPRSRRRTTATGTPTGTGAAARTTPTAARTTTKRNAPGRPQRATAANATSSGHSRTSETAAPARRPGSSRTSTRPNANGPTGSRPSSPRPAAGCSRRRR
jgi:hypothetical protein